MDFMHQAYGGVVINNLRSMGPLSDDPHSVRFLVQDYIGTPPQTDYIINQLGMIVPPGVMPQEYVRQSAHLYEKFRLRNEGDVLTISNSSDLEIISHIGLIPEYNNRTELESQMD